MQRDMNLDSKAFDSTTSNRATTPAQTGGKGENIKEGRSAKNFTPSTNQPQISTPAAQMPASALAIKAMVAQAKKKLEQISSDEERIQSSRTEIHTMLKYENNGLEKTENLLSVRLANAREEINKISAVAERLKMELAKAKDDLSTAFSVERDISKEWDEFSEKKKEKIDGPQKLAILDKDLEVKKEEKEKLRKLMELLKDEDIADMLLGKENVL